MQTTDPDNFFRAEADLAVTEARKKKAERTKNVGDPIDLPGKPIAAQIRGSDLWVAQSDAVVRRVDLETGSILQLYRGHKGPVTTLALLDSVNDNGPPILISGSWDKTVKLWSTVDKSLISSTEAHSDFVKCVFPVPELKLLVSSGSDKIVRFWDVTDAETREPLKILGVVSAHTRPVQCLAIDVHSSSSATLYSADSMGVILVWDLERTYGDSPACRATLTGDLNVHRTGVNDMRYGQKQLWTASSDETVILHSILPQNVSNLSKPIPPFTHPHPVRAVLPLALTELEEPYLLTAYCDVIRLYDISSPEEHEILSETDAHWHDVMALRLWIRSIKTEGGKSAVEPWIVSASLDGTIRRWRLADLITPLKETKRMEKVEEKKVDLKSHLTAEEEAELDELMDDD